MITIPFFFIYISALEVQTRPCDRQLCDPSNFAAETY